MKGAVKKIPPWFLGIPVLVGLGLAMHRSEEYKRVQPLTKVSSDLDAFDTNPKDNVLSVQESGEYLKKIVDKEQNSFLSKAEVDDALKTISSLEETFQTSHKNTKESAKNLARALDFILIRQTLNDANGVQQYSQHRPKELSYSEFYKLAFQEEKQLLTKVTFKTDSDKMHVFFQDGSENIVCIPSNIAAMKDLADKLISKSVEVKVDSNTDEWQKYALIFGPMVIFLGFMLLIMSGRKGGNFLSQITGVGMSREKFLKPPPKTTFNDVAGLEEPKQELQETVDFLKIPERFKKMNARMPKGVLLVGPPGTGKTLLARAVAGEAKVPFYSLSGSDFVEMFVGIGAARVRDLFKTAKETAPCVIFIDEIDAAGRRRGAGLGSGHDEKEQTLNQILVEMDGFEPTDGVVVLAATNRPDVLDPALLRPGRFDREVVLDIPDVNGREAILEIHAKEKPLAKDVDLKVIAQRTYGKTGADLANILNEAAILAVRNKKEEITMEELEGAIDRVTNGIEKKSRVISPKDKEITAYHEAGHAILAYFEKDVDPLHKITIIPRGSTLGVTQMRPKEDHTNFSKSQLEARVRVALGGRIAEMIVFNEITTGAESDLMQITDIVKSMITRFGMSEKLGLRTFGGRSQEVFLGRDFTKAQDYSEDVAKQIDQEIKDITDRLKGDVQKLLIDKRKHLDALAQVLLKEETIDIKRVEEILKQVDDGSFKSEEV